MARAEVDSHVHVIDRDRFEYNVVEFRTSPALARDWSETMYAAEAPASTTRAVFVEVNAADEAVEGEARWALAMCADPASRFCSAVISAPLERGGAAVAAFLDALGPSPHLGGVRRLMQDRPAGFSTTAEFADGVAEVSRRGLAVEICVREPDWYDAILVASRAAAAGARAIVLDHCGKPPVCRGEDGLKAWTPFITTLAAVSPAVVCKLSGLPGEAGAGGWTPAAVAPFLRLAWRVFGARRLMFGSDWFVCRLACGAGGEEAAAEVAREWERCVRATLLAEGASADDLAEVFGGTARRVYRIPE